MDKKSEFGSVKWQEDMLERIKDKTSRGEKLEDHELAFIETQAEHNHKILEGY